MLHNVQYVFLHVIMEIFKNQHFKLTEINSVALSDTYNIL